MGPLSLMTPIKLQNITKQTNWLFSTLCVSGIHVLEMKCNYMKHEKHQQVYSRKWFRICITTHLLTTTQNFNLSAKLITLKQKHSPCRKAVAVLRPTMNTHLLIDGGDKDATPGRLEEAHHERLQHARISSSKREMENFDFVPFV
ncbi:hypothetical protein E2C01_010598 [Portunus trituberculatus]|uniref:Uncharacterized protein n=1 Tax=Portunus trituberculatus TaxID=210409 RepID=A0A5B7D8W5_PORTR|nr:hypothetical protein [Portunus trituberculatus]